MFIEEAFERLLLNYDRVFSAMGIPACLWRRTGEIYKVQPTFHIGVLVGEMMLTLWVQGNKEFADLVGVDVTQLRDVSCNDRHFSVSYLCLLLCEKSMGFFLLIWAALISGSYILLT